MARLRDKLYAEGRMNFPPEKKVVRPMGGALTFLSGVWPRRSCFRATRCRSSGTRRCSSCTGDRPTASPTGTGTTWSEQVVALDGVHGVATFAVGHAPGEQFDIAYFEGDPVDQTKAIRAAAPHHAEATVLADAPFLFINYLHYPWADAIRASSLPKTVND